jgi:hypothetical protein
VPIENSDSYAIDRSATKACVLGLFDESASGSLYYLPAFEADETLYSWCARYHLLSGNVLPRQTSQQLFAHASAGLHPDFPMCIDQLVKRSNGTLGNREDLIFQRTPFCVFARFLDKERVALVTENMGARSAPRISRMLGLVVSRIEHPVQLRACNRCIKADVEAYGTSIWHLEHQLPGVMICRAHKTPLLAARSAAQVRATTDYLLPGMIPDQEWHVVESPSDALLARLESIASWSPSLALASESHSWNFDDELLRITCHRQAHSRGWTDTRGLLQFQRIRTAFVEATRDLIAVPGFSVVENANQQAGGLVGLLLRRYRAYHHPLKHILLLSFLFDSPDEFLNAYQASASCAPEERRLGLEGDRATLLPQLLALVDEQKMSVNRAAAKLGITIVRAIRYLKKAQAVYRPRPRIVGTELETKLIAGLRRGESATTLAREIGIRRNFIKDYLASNVEVRSEYEIAREKVQRDEYRAKFLKVLADYPTLPIRRIRRETNSGFEWLYRHDRNWLVEQLPAIWHR